MSRGDFDANVVRTAIDGHDFDEFGIVAGVMEKVIVVLIREVPFEPTAEIEIEPSGGRARPQPIVTLPSIEVRVGVKRVPFKCVGTRTSRDGISTCASF